MASLEQVRAIFDQGGMGLVLIGMPGLEKRLARYAQLYSRVGFVHEFCARAEPEVRNLLLGGWQPPGVALPSDGLSDEEALAAILRITDGNFRLLSRLLTQIARVLTINNLRQGGRGSARKPGDWHCMTGWMREDKARSLLRYGCSRLPSSPYPKPPSAQSPFA